jgi:hypothetical protein
MAKLTSKARNKLPPGKFGIPGKKGAPGKYPMPNKAHAADAEGRATQMVAKGKLSPEAASKIKHKAQMVLGEGDCKYHNA